MVILGAIIMVLFVAIVFLNPLLDTFDRRGWQCEVVSAEPAQGGRGLRGSASTPYVVVDTENCGEIIVEGKTVNFDNLEQIAASFEPGSQWIFEIGWYSRYFGRLVERMPPASQEYHELVEHGR